MLVGGNFNYRWLRKEYVDGGEKKDQTEVAHLCDTFDFSDVSV